MYMIPVMEISLVIKQPKPNEPAKVSSTLVKIMPLGDSIPWGTLNGISSSTDNGYRKSLFQQLYGAGYDGIDFVGSQMSGQSSPDIDHEGHPGWMAKTYNSNGYDCCSFVSIYNGLLSSLNTDGYNFLGDYNPDIILLHIGTNDLSSGSQQNPTGASLADEVIEILNVIWNYNPDIVTFVAQIIDRNDDATLHQRTLDFNSSLATKIATRSSSQQAKIVLVNMYSALGDWSSTYYSDNLHPNNTGYGLMADKWFAKMQNYYQPVLAGPADGAVDQACGIPSLSWSSPPAAASISRCYL